MEYVDGGEMVILKVSRAFQMDVITAGCCADGGLIGAKIGGTAGSIIGGALGWIVGGVISRNGVKNEFAIVRWVPCVSGTYTV